MREMLKRYFCIPNNDKEIVIRYEPELIRLDQKRILLLSIAYTVILLLDKFLNLVAGNPNYLFESIFGLSSAIWCISFCYIIPRAQKSKNTKFNKSLVVVFWSILCVLGICLSVSWLYYKHSPIYFILHIMILAFVPLNSTSIIYLLIFASLIAQVVAIYKFVPQSQGYKFIVGCIIITVFAVFLRRLNSYLYRNQMFFSYNERRFESVLKDLYEKAFEVDLDRDMYILLKNDMFRFKRTERVVKYSAVVGNMAENYIHPEDKDLFIKKTCADNLRRLFADNDNILNIEYRQIDNKGDYRWVSLTFLRATSAGNNLILFGLVKDIHKSKINEERLKREAQMDQLTNLYNKVTTERLITDFLQNDRSGGNHTFIMIDIDNFKNINDTYGHFYGDSVLSHMSAIIRKSFRLSDIVGRVGGDELVVFMKNVHSVEYVHEKVNVLAGSFRQELCVNDKTIKISSSIGIAIYDIDGKTYDELYRNADAALYEAKKQGKDRVVFHSDLSVIKT